MILVPLESDFKALSNGAKNLQTQINIDIDKTKIILKNKQLQKKCILQNTARIKKEYTI